MQLYGTIILRDFAAKHPDSRAHIAAWEREIAEATWPSPRQLQERFVSAQVSKGGGVVFRLLRGLYKLGTKVRFDKGILIVESAWADDQPAKVGTGTKKK